MKPIEFASIGSIVILVGVMIFMLKTNHELEKERDHANWERDKWKEVASLFSNKVIVTPGEKEKLLFQGSAFGININHPDYPVIRGSESWSNGDLSICYRKYLIYVPGFEEEFWIWVQTSGGTE